MIVGDFFSADENLFPLDLFFGIDEQKAERTSE
jgi:hypothetical protein